MIDSHCHLAGAEFTADLAEVVARARGAGLQAALVVLSAGDEAEAGQFERVQTLWPDTRASIGVHPHSAGDYAGRADAAAAIVRAQFERTPPARALGEMGLDYHYDFAPRDVQRDVFAAQVVLARELDRPIVIHTREADADTVEILKREGQGDVRGVFHCFTGTQSLADAALDLGFHISLAGIVTFNRAEELRDVARRVPLDRLLVETDSPFLAPVPLRGKRNEPAFVAHVVERLAALHAIAPAELAERTATNFRLLFRP